jgi:heme O synthase-like polyprenyltransferase
MAGPSPLRDYAALAKPRITLMVALSAAAGYLLAGRGADAGLWWCVLGTSLAAAATGTLNQAMEAAQDARMGRTKGRPLPSGRLTRKERSSSGSSRRRSGTRSSGRSAAPALSG